jgi:hypothetical protein
MISKKILLPIAAILIISSLALYRVVVPSNYYFECDPEDVFGSTHNLKISEYLWGAYYGLDDSKTSDCRANAEQIDCFITGKDDLIFNRISGRLEIFPEDSKKKAEYFTCKPSKRLI